MNKILHSTEFLELKATNILDNGNEWYYAHRTKAKNIILIIPVIREEFIVFLKTRRPPIIAEGIGEYCIELPAGLVGDEVENETIEQALKKELLEEVGMLCHNFKILANKIASSSGLTDENCTVAVANIKESTIYKEPVSDGGVIVERIRVPIKNIKKWISEQLKQNYVISAQTLGALYLYLG